MSGGCVIGGMREDEAKEEDCQSFSFSGCGFLGIYHIGVASCLKEHAPDLVKNAKILGASAGAIIGCCILCDCCLGDCTSFVLELATQARKKTLGAFSPGTSISKRLREGLRKILPTNAHEICSGRLFVSLTRLHDFKNVVISKFRTRENLIEVLMCSSHVPVFSGWLPPIYKGTAYIDGGFSDNVPVLNDKTVTVTPFAGESDICPRDANEQLQHFMLKNTSMQCSINNVNRLSGALLPFSPEILSDMCKQGFDDTLVFLRKHKLVHCTRHLTLHTTIKSRRSRESYIHRTAQNAELAACEDCNQKFETARRQSLPRIVLIPLSEACDNIGMLERLMKTRTVRYLYYLATPWRVGMKLPWEIMHGMACRTIEVLPALPRDVTTFALELKDMFYEKYMEWRKEESGRNVKCHMHRSTTKKRKTRHTQDSGVQVMAPISENQNNFQPVRDLDIGFDVNLDISEEGATKRHHLDSVRVSAVKVRDDSRGGLIPHNHDESSVPYSSAQAMPCEMAYGTFEQCLNVVQHMESVLSYHYTSEDSEGRQQVETIYNLRNANSDLTQLEVPAAASDEPPVVQEEEIGPMGHSDLSWDDFVQLHPELESDLDSFVKLSLPESDSDTSCDYKYASSEDKNS